MRAVVWGRRAAILSLLCLCASPSSAGDDGKTRPIDFNRDVRPILSENCFLCHGPSKEGREADLRLDVREGALADLGGFSAIVPGKPEASALVQRITSKDANERMPPRKSRKSLTPDQVKTLVEWVRQGAGYAPPWAYVPPRPLSLPPRGRNFIDAWVLARLDREGLAPAPEADRRTLLRRLSFDLTGLPPEPAEADAFAADRDPAAYEKQVERLLASPHYGERMALHWLDLVRYADTVGYHGDQDHNISPYRDWVIDAFNDNLPFDRFTLEQLAGDLLPAPSRVEGPDPTVDQKIATGYNRVLQTSHEGGVQPREYLAMYAADRVRNFSQVWLGGTMGCANCHDHKYDPYTIEDFYRMAAFFADVDEEKHLRGGGTDSIPTKRPPEIPVLHRLERAELAEVEERLRTAGEKEKAELAARREAILKRARLTMITVAVAPRVTRVLARGNWMDESGKVVQPAVPHFLPQPADPGRRLTRLDLARWLTAKENGIAGLTARVFVNRLWYLFFGTGLAKVLDDFGGQGEPPSHPELLDALAVEFVESGWDVKRLVRLVVTSATYRQSSLDTRRERDPHNRLLARQARFRLPAEMIRDNALAVSGLLVRKMYGRPARPYQPDGYYRHLNFPARTYKADRDENQYRRGVYLHWQRQFLHPAMLAFDAPRREECAAQRPISNTPLAALALLNDPSMVEAARALAARVMKGGGTFEGRLDLAFRAVLSRPPLPAEVPPLRKLYRAHEAEFREDPAAAAAVQKSGLYAAPKDLDPAELAAWTSVARALLNLNEAITRN